MSNKINISVIVADHFKTMQNERTNKLSRIDIATFFGLPLALGALSFFVGFELMPDAVTVLIAALAVFSGLLVNVLVLIYSLTDAAVQSGRNELPRSQERLRFLKEVFANLSFAILVAVFCILLLSWLIFVRGAWAQLLTAIFVACCLNFLMTFLMALKRIHILLRNRLPG